MLAQNKLISRMELNRSRLSSITEQSNELEPSLKTQLALLMVYYQLYAINYVDMTVEPKDVFRDISQQIQNQNSDILADFKPFSEQQAQQKSKKQRKIIEKIRVQSQNLNKIILSKEELQSRLELKLYKSPIKSSIRQQKFSQTPHLQKSYNKDLDETAQSRISLSDVMQKLNDFDMQRTEIKFQIYSQQGNKLDNLYHKWASLHKKMKETLEIYLNKVGNGKSLLQLYSQLDEIKNSKKTIEGYSQKQLMCKLDNYIQSLFLDERQILLYRNQTEKSRSIRSATSNQNRQVRKKLTYN